MKNPNAVALGKMGGKSKSEAKLAALAQNRKKRWPRLQTGEDLKRKAGKFYLLKEEC